MEVAIASSQDDSSVKPRSCQLIILFHVIEIHQSTVSTVHGSLQYKVPRAVRYCLYNLLCTTQNLGKTSSPSFHSFSSVAPLFLPV